MLRWQHLIPLLLLSTLSCASVPPLPALMPSELLANAEFYDGRHVRVRGYAVVQPEARTLWDTEADVALRHSDRCIGLDGPGEFFDAPFRRRYRESLSGVFHANYCGSHDLCPYWCNASIIVLDRGSRP